ncbi:hypothetical protein Pcinc_014150 [Petrolisthes cinctipes]|uniref:Reverse transcriptase domain-containing protein n=1 Tax=Petrolisthes cinctipes TaxID=88211 RepID=A0AAE1KRM5_PETCI|nr:hypothetical protein Pcinc_014150 [Petrolisthes cinctipes]
MLRPPDTVAEANEVTDGQGRATGKGRSDSAGNYRTISLISHASKVMLRIILDRLKPQAENIIAEEQAGFRKGRSTIEQIFNLRLLCEKHSNTRESSTTSS